MFGNQAQKTEDKGVMKGETEKNSEFGVMAY